MRQLFGKVKETAESIAAKAAELKRKSGAKNGEGKNLVNEATLFTAEKAADDNHQAGDKQKKPAAPSGNYGACD